MFRLWTFGSVDLRGPDGSTVDAVLAQPKRLALLVYLTIARPHGYHRRDALLALFWPELDQEHARGALSGALHHLRKVLGEEAIRSRGTEEVAVSDEHVWCDVAAFEAALEAGRLEEALELYRGNLLEAFHVSGVPDFERWLDAERGHLRERASVVANKLVDSAEALCDLTGAVDWARRAMALAPYDEEMVRRLMGLLDRAGDRAEAIRTYEEFGKSISESLEVKPSAETQALAAEIRAQVVSLEAVPPSEKIGKFVPARSIHRRLSLGTALIIAVAAIAVGATAYGFMNGRGSARSSDASDFTPPRWVLVAEFEGENVDPEVVTAVRDLATVAVDQSGVVASAPLQMLGRALESAGKPDTARLVPELALEVAFRYGFVAVVTGRISRVGDGFAVILRVLRPEDGSVITSASETARDTDALIPTVDRLARQLRERLGENSAMLAASMLLEEVTTPSFGAYQDYRRARDAQRIRDWRGSNEHVRAALARDSGLAMAWRLMASNYRALRAFDSASYAMEQALRHAEGRSQTEQLHIQAYVAWIRDGDLERAVELYSQILRINPRDLIAHYNKGVFLQWLFRYEEALEQFLIVARLQPFGMAANHAGSLGATLRLLGRADEMRPYLEYMRPDQRMHLRWHAAAIGNDFAATESFALAVLADPPEDLALASMHTGLLASAKAARGAVWEAANTMGLQSMLADGYQWTWADHRVALAVATRCNVLARVAPFPSWPDTASFLLREHAISALVVGDSVEAWRLLQQEQHRPAGERENAPELQMLFDALRWAQMDEWSGLVTAARSHARQRLHFGSTGQPTIRWLMGQGFERLGELDSAIVYYRLTTDSVALGHGSMQNRGCFYPFVHRKLAGLYWQLGDRRAADRHWQTFRETFRTPDPELEWLVDTPPWEGTDRWQEACDSYTRRLEQN